MPPSFGFAAMLVVVGLLSFACEAAEDTEESGGCYEVIEERGGCSAMDYAGPRRGCLYEKNGECWVGGVYFWNYEVTPVEDGCSPG